LKSHQDLLNFKITDFSIAEESEGFLCLVYFESSEEGSIFIDFADKNNARIDMKVGDNYSELLIAFEEYEHGLMLKSRKHPSNYPMLDTFMKEANKRRVYLCPAIKLPDGAYLSLGGIKVFDPALL
jgi:hypothetical protein